MTSDSALALVRAIEVHAARAWPSQEVVRLHGWELRFTSGSRSRRVNSLTAIAPEPGRFRDALRLARRLCADRGVPCTVRLTPLAGDEAASVLAGMGLQETRDPTSVQVAPVGRPEGTAGVIVEAEGGAAWLEGLSTTGADAAERALVAGMLQSVPMPQAFARIEADGTPVAVGRAACDGGVVGLFNIATAPSARRQGHGRALVAAMLAWARAQGAMRAYLQVVAANAPAIALYAGFGFREAYRYDYVTVPPEAAD